MKNHRSHISAKESRQRGWRRVPPLAVRNKTRQLAKRCAVCGGNIIRGKDGPECLQCGRSPDGRKARI